MKNFFYVLAFTCLLMITACGGDSDKIDPNAPIANQPGAATNGWTADNIAIASERCAAYGLSNSNLRWQPWYNFCQCGYSAIAAVPKCTYEVFSGGYANYCINQAQTAIDKCEQSAGISGSGSGSADTSLAHY